MDYVAQLTAPLGERAVGFKLPLSSIRAHPDALGLLEPDELRVIRLRRLNLLALFVSRRLLAAPGSRGPLAETTAMRP